MANEEVYAAGLLNRALTSALKRASIETVKLRPMAMEKSVSTDSTHAAEQKHRRHRQLYHVAQRDDLRLSLQSKQRAPARSSG